MKRHTQFLILGLSLSLTACIPSKPEPVWTLNLGNDSGSALRHVSATRFVRYFPDNGVLKAQQYNYSDGEAIGSELTLALGQTGSFIFSPESATFYRKTATSASFKLEKFDANLNRIWLKSSANIAEWAGIDVADVEVHPSNEGETVLVKAGHYITKLDEAGNLIAIKRFYNGSQPSALPSIRAASDDQTESLVQLTNTYTALDSDLLELGQFNSSAFKNHNLHIYDGYIYHAPQSAAGAEFCKQDLFGNEVWCQNPVIDSASGEYRYKQGATYAIDIETYTSVTKFDSDGEIVWSKTFLYTDSLDSVVITGDGVFVELGRDLGLQQEEDVQGIYQSNSSYVSLNHITHGGVLRTLTMATVEQITRLNYSGSPKSYSAGNGVTDVVTHLHHDGQYVLLNNNAGDASFATGTVVTETQPHFELTLFD